MLGRTGTRTTTGAVTFTRPFRLGSDPRELPPGVYVMHTQEDIYEGAYDALYLSVSIDFEVPQRGGKSVRIIRPDDLASALERDRSELPEMTPMKEVPPDEQSILDRYGISRVPADTFHVGGYRYSNMSDAVAAAKRLEAEGHEREGSR